jgi:beta-xylosidase
MLPLFLRRGTVALALTAAVLGCADEPITTSALDPTDTSSPVGPGQLPGTTQYTNPVYAGDFPDPYVLRVGAVYYAYSTNAGIRNVPTLRSSDLVNWEPVGDALPVLPSWAESGRRLTWAPAVLALERGYVLLYTARNHYSGRQCIGRAESPSPTGPFLDESPTPFICQVDLGGSIDPSIVRDTAGDLYVIWKNDGNCCGHPVSLWSQRLSGDARSLVGNPVEILRQDQAWEGALIEGPTMWQAEGTWHLLYSANRWNTEHYATGYAECRSPLGPCHKPMTAPIIASDAETSGPGGAEVFTDLDGHRWLAYHGWTAGRVGYRQGGARSLRIDRVELSGTQLLVLAPTATSQIIP